MVLADPCDRGDCGLPGWRPPTDHHHRHTRLPLQKPNQGDYDGDDNDEHDNEHDDDHYDGI